MCVSGGRAGDRLAASEPTILVVDDDPVVASTAEQYLRRLGDVTVTVETDPEAALATFERGDVDAVVSDYEMPGMDGLELLAAVRERDATVPFVLFTGVADEGVAERARDRDGDYVPKRGGATGFDRLADRVADRLADSESPPAPAAADRQSP